MDTRTWRLVEATLCSTDQASSTRPWASTLMTTTVSTLPNITTDNRQHSFRGLAHGRGPRS